MLKRIAVLTIILTMCLCWIAVPSNADTISEEAALRASIQKQFNAYAKNLNRTDVHEDAIRQLLTHAIGGHGKDLHMGEDAATTASLFNAALFQEFAVEALLIGTQISQKQHLDRVMVGTDSIGWHEFAVEYRVSHFFYDDTLDTKDDKVLDRPVPATPYTGALNANDKAMALVVGGASCRFRLKQTRTTVNEITFSVQFYVQDTFSFDSDYKHYKDEGYNTSLSDLINLTGKMLDHGLLDTYNWSLQGDFELKVPNMCTHKSAEYSWTWNGTDLESVTDGGFLPNPLERIQTEKKDGTLDDPYYKVKETIMLRHELPWVVEYRMKGSGMFMLSNGKTYAAEGQPYLLKSWGHVIGGEYFKYDVTDENTGETVKKGGRKQYGMDVSTLGIRHSEWHTYRLENRIAADGTNMVWLLVDGIQIGAMESYFLNINSVNEDQQTKVDWFNGRDIAINYIFNDICGMTSNTNVEYLRIWENGETNGLYNFFASTVVNPTCTERGYTMHKCSMCGASYRDGYVDAQGHRYEKTETVAATCTTEGYSTYRCTVCSDRICSEKVGALGHALGEWFAASAADCVNEGLNRRNCANCTYSETEVIPAVGHALGEWFVASAADCVNEGLNQRNCANCTYSETEVIPAVGHALGEWFAASAADCVNDGLNQRNCANCTYSETEVLPATGHSYTATVSKVTCTQDGYTTYTCACGDGYTADVVSATGHAWDYGTVTLEATCAGPGEMTYTCTACTETRMESIAEVPHTPGPDATQTSDQICTACGKVLNPATGVPNEPTQPSGEMPTDPEDPTDAPGAAWLIPAVVMVVLACAGLLIFMVKKPSKTIINHKNRYAAKRTCFCMCA